MTLAARFENRFGAKTAQAMVAVAIALFMLGTMAFHVSAEGNFKDNFSKGCTDSGGSFVDNADGSFQCNNKYGNTVKCTDPEGKTPCTYSEGAALEAPSPTSTPGTKVVAQSVSGAKRVNMMAPTDTPEPTVIPGLPTPIDDGGVLLAPAATATPSSTATVVTNANAGSVVNGAVEAAPAQPTAAPTLEVVSGAISNGAVQAAPALPTLEAPGSANPAIITTGGVLSQAVPAPQVTAIP